MNNGNTLVVSWVRMIEIELHNWTGPQYHSHIHVDISGEWHQIKLIISSLLKNEEGKAHQEEMSSSWLWDEHCWPHLMIFSLHLTNQSPKLEGQWWRRIYLGTSTNYSCTYEMSAQQAGAYGAQKKGQLWAKLINSSTFAWDISLHLIWSCQQFLPPVHDGVMVLLPTV